MKQNKEHIAFMEMLRREASFQWKDSDEKTP